MSWNDEYNSKINENQQKQNDAASKNRNEWDKMLSQARMAMAMDGQTALGLALGKLLRGAWDSYKNSQKQKDNNNVEGDNPYVPYGSTAQTTTQAATQTAVQTPEGVATQETSFTPWNDVIKGALANGEAYKEQGMQNASSPEAVSQFFQQGLALSPEEFSKALGHGKQLTPDILQYLGGR